MVEWLRSCYTSSWLLPGLTLPLGVPGHYVFAPEGTPHFPGLHWWGSRNWTTGDFPGGTEFGEQREERQKWHSGLQPNPFPSPIPIGDGLDPLRGEPLGDYYAGFPDACYVQVGTSVRQATDFLDIESREGQRFGAELLDSLYTDDTVAAAELLAYLGPGASVASVPNTASVIPGTVIGVRGDYCVVVIAGTTNFFQAATYSLTSGLGPVNCGDFSTNATWWLGAESVQNRVLAAGPNPAGRILLIGHSYGGAIATILAGQYLAHNPTRPVDLLTYGAPKLGDERLNVLLRRGRLIRMADVGDPVPSMPPALPSSLQYFSALGGTVLANWAAFLQPLGQRVIDELGVVAENEDTTLSWAYMAAIVASLGGGPALTQPFAHSIAAYLLRLSL